MPKYQFDIGELAGRQDLVGKTVVVEAPGEATDAELIERGLAQVEPPSKGQPQAGIFERLRAATQPGAEYVAHAIRKVSPLELGLNPEARKELKALVTGQTTPSSFKDKPPTILGDLLNPVPGSKTEAAVLAATGGIGKVATRLGLTGAKALAARVGVPAATQYVGGRLEGEDPMQAIVKSAIIGLSQGASEGIQALHQKGKPFIKQVASTGKILDVDAADTKQAIQAMRTDVPAYASMLDPDDPASLVKMSGKAGSNALSEFYRDNVVKVGLDELGGQDLRRPLGALMKIRDPKLKTKPLEVEEAIDLLLGQKAKRRIALRSKEKSLPENQRIINFVDKAEGQYLALLSPEGQHAYEEAARNYRDGHVLRDFLIDNQVVRTDPKIGIHVKFRANEEHSLGQAILDHRDEMTLERFPMLWSAVTREHPGLAMDALTTLSKGERVSTRVPETGQFLAISIPQVKRLQQPGKLVPPYVNQALLNLLAAKGAQTGIARMGLVPQGNKE